MIELATLLVTTSASTVTVPPLIVSVPWPSLPTIKLPLPSEFVTYNSPPMPTESWSLTPTAPTTRLLWICHVAPLPTTRTVLAPPLPKPAANPPNAPPVLNTAPPLLMVRDWFKPPTIKTEALLQTEPAPVTKTELLLPVFELPTVPPLLNTAPPLLIARLLPPVN